MFGGNKGLTAAASLLRLSRLPTLLRFGLSSSCLANCFRWPNTPQADALSGEIRAPSDILIWLGEYQELFQLDGDDFRGLAVGKSNGPGVAF